MHAAFSWALTTLPAGDRPHLAVLSSFCLLGGTGSCPSVVHGKRSGTDGQEPVPPGKCASRDRGRVAFDTGGASWWSQPATCPRKSASPVPGGHGLPLCTGRLVKCADGQEPVPPRKESFWTYRGDLWSRFDTGGLLVAGKGHGWGCFTSDLGGFGRGTRNAERIPWHRDQKQNIRRNKNARPGISRKAWRSAVCRRRRGQARLANRE